MADEIDEEAAAVREQLLIGRVPMRVFGLAVGLGARALYDYMAQGLPFRRINNRRYIVPAEAAAWLDRRAARCKAAETVVPEPPRPVGRPRKLAKNSHASPGEHNG
jgi:hypothetical protein